MHSLIDTPDALPSHTHTQLAMSGVNRKRPADTNVTAPAPKRTATGQSSEAVVIEEDDDKQYHVTAKLSSKFAVFPDALRNQLQTTYETTIQHQMAALHSNIALKFKYTYSVITERRVRQCAPSNEPNFTICKDNMVSLSASQIRLSSSYSWSPRKSRSRSQDLCFSKDRKGYRILTSPSSMRCVIMRLDGALISTAALVCTSYTSTRVG
jgi:hypothetical protein